MTSQPIKIVGIVVTATVVTLYKADGTTILLKQGDPVMRHVVDDIIPAIKANGFAEYRPETIEVKRNPYAEYEEQSGFVKFFSVARKKLAAFFNTKEEETKPVTEEPIAPCTIGVITPSKPSLTTVEPVLGIVPKANEPDEPDVAPVEEKVTMDELMQSAVSVSDIAEFDSKSFVKPIDLNATSHEINRYERQREEEENVLIAKVGDTIIPEADRLLAQVTHSVDKGSTVGMDNLVRRLGAIINSRQHTVQDVLRFIQRADLGISDNGDIIVYKALQRSQKLHIDIAQNELTQQIFDGHNIYVDRHSNRVNQRVGMLVTVAENYVDTSRSIECAQGLHVARRAYLREFKCDTCVMCVVRPEDFIAVPYKDYNKVRVSAYHVISELSQEEYELLLNNQSIAKTRTGQEKLDKAMRNCYPAPVCKVVINGSNGTKLDYSWLTNTTVKPPMQEVEEPVNFIPAMEDSLEAIDTATRPAKVVQPDDVGNAPVKEEKPAKPKSPAQPPKAKSAKGSAIKDILAGKSPATLTDNDKEALRAIKRKQKKSWKVLGVSEAFQAVL